MIPLWLYLLMIAVAVTFGLSVGTFIGLRTRKSAIPTVEEAKPSRRKPNVFDAYTDKELQEVRNTVTKLIQWRRRNQYDVYDHVLELRNIDEEFDNRKKAKLAVEMTSTTIRELEMAAFNHALEQAIGEPLKKEKK